jgi:hypothetical protein
MSPAENAAYPRRTRATSGCSAMASPLTCAAAQTLEGKPAGSLAPFRPGRRARRCRRSDPTSAAGTRYRFPVFGSEIGRSPYALKTAIHLPSHSSIRYCAYVASASASCIDRGRAEPRSRVTRVRTHGGQRNERRDGPPKRYRSRSLAPAATHRDNDVMSTLPEPVSDVPATGIGHWLRWRPHASMTVVARSGRWRAGGRTRPYRCVSSRQR